MSHDFAIEFVRPGLGTLIKIYLKLIDDIDYDELVDTLKIIVEIFSEEIAPYAEELCVRLSESYIRIMESQKDQGADQLEVDTETCLTADGLMTAIRRILQSISGRYVELYPKLEQILHQPIVMALNDEKGNSIEEALSCLTELLYHQPQIS